MDLKGLTYIVIDKCLCDMNNLFLKRKGNSASICYTLYAWELVIWEIPDLSILHSFIMTTFPSEAGWPNLSWGWLPDVPNFTEFVILYSFMKLIRKSWKKTSTLSPSFHLSSKLVINYSNYIFKSETSIWSLPKYVSLSKSDDTYLSLLLLLLLVRQGVCMGVSNWHGGISFGLLRCALYRFCSSKRQQK